jgi:hypothetical protein
VSEGDGGDFFAELCEFPGVIGNERTPCRGKTLRKREPLRNTHVMHIFGDRQRDCGLVAYPKGFSPGRSPGAKRISDKW